MAREPVNVFLNNQSSSSTAAPRQQEMPQSGRSPVNIFLKDQPASIPQPKQSGGGNIFSGFSEKIGQAGKTFSEKVSHGFYAAGNFMDKSTGGVASTIFNAGAIAYTTNPHDDLNKKRDQNLYDQIAKNPNKDSRNRQMAAMVKAGNEQRQQVSPFEDTMKYYDRTNNHKTDLGNIKANLPLGMQAGLGVGALLTASPVVQAGIGGITSVLSDTANGRAINWKNSIISTAAGYAFGSVAHGTGVARGAVTSAAGSVERGALSGATRFFGSKLGGAASRVGASGLIQGTSSGLTDDGTGRKFTEKFGEGAKQGLAFAAGFEGVHGAIEKYNIAGGDKVQSNLDKSKKSIQDALAHYDVTEKKPGFIQLWGALEPEFTKSTLHEVEEGPVKEELSKNLDNLRSTQGLHSTWKEALANAGVTRGTGRLTEIQAQSKASQVAAKRSSPEMKKWVKDEVAALDPSKKDLSNAMSRVMSRPELAEKFPKIQKLVDSQFGLVHESVEKLMDARPMTDTEASAHIEDIKSEIVQQHGTEGLQAIYQEIDLSKTPQKQVSDWYKARMKSEQIAQENRTPQEAVGTSQPEDKLEHDVPHEPSKNIFADVMKNLKATAQDIRDSYSGMNNSLKLEGIQISDKMRKLAKSELVSIDWALDAKGDSRKLTEWANDPALAKHRSDILRAIDLSPKAQEAYQRAQNYYEKTASVSMELGIIHNVRENYSNRIVKSRPVKGTDIEGNQKRDERVKGMESNSGLKQSFRQGKARVYDTKAEAMRDGVEYATHNSADLLQKYSEDYAAIVAKTQFMNYVKNQNLGSWFTPSEVPEGWKAIDKMEQDVPLKTSEGKMVVGPDGNQSRMHQIFAMPEALTNGVKAITEARTKNDPNSFRGRVDKYQALVKSYDLSLSFFHHVTLLSQTAYQLGNNPVLAYKMVRSWNNEGMQEGLSMDFVKHGGMLTTLDKGHNLFAEIMPEEKTYFIKKMEGTSGIKDIKKIADLVPKLMEKQHEFLFDNLQRKAKTLDYGQKMEKWNSKHPNASEPERIAAKRGFSREINAAFGGLNWESLGITKNTVATMRSLLLAPDWTYSNVDLAKLGVSKGTGGAAARAHLISAFIISTVTTQLLNKITMGDRTDKTNAKGHELDWQVKPGVYISLYRGGIGDMIKLASDIYAQSNQPTNDGTLGYGTGTVKGALQFAQGKASPLLRGASELASWTDFYGKPLTDSNKSRTENALNVAQSVGSSVLPIPFGVAPTVKEAKTGDIAGAALVGTGIARPGQTKDQSDASQMYVDAQTAKNTKTAIEKSDEKSYNSGDKTAFQGLPGKTVNKLKKAASLTERRAILKETDPKAEALSKMPKSDQKAWLAKHPDGKSSYDNAQAVLRGR